MPIYQYQCDECGHLFEKLMKLSDPEPSQCPECGADDPRRTIAQTAFQLKGSGWYVTDYKGGKPGAGATARDKESGGSTGDTQAGQAPSSDSKPTEKSGTSDTSDPAPAKVQGAA